jgi:hypothetical protein
MTIAGILMILLGSGSLFFGYQQNNSLEAQWNSLMGTGVINPGTPFMIGGTILVAIGIILLIFGLMKNNRQTR